MANKRKKKLRADFRKHYGSRTRPQDLTGQFQRHGFEHDDSVRQERVSGKGELTRRRTVIGEAVEEDETGVRVRLDVDEAVCQRGRVLSVHGRTSTVQDEAGRVFQCTTRRLLKTLSSDQRHVVAAGDRVLFLPAASGEGCIERIEPRRGILCRTSKGRQHVIVANVDQLLIVASAAEPALKPNLIDRFIVTAEKSHIRPILCLNKIDLVDPADLQPFAGVYGQLGYRVLLVSSKTGFGIERVLQVLRGQQSVVAGQSGVGKSSLLNAIEPGLELRVNTVSSENQKGRHTTAAGQLIRLASGGYVVDTPGIRQFQLWDVIPAELAGFFRDLRPYVSRCRFPDCTHTHEAACAIKDAVGDGRLDARRYESYCQMFLGDEV